VKKKPNKLKKPLALKPAAAAGSKPKDSVIKPRSKPSIGTVGAKPVIGTIDRKTAIGTVGGGKQKPVIGPLR
jgi:hypothetical protein